MPPERLLAPPVSRTASPAPAPALPDISAPVAGRPAMADPARMSRLLGNQAVLRMVLPPVGSVTVEGPAAETVPEEEMMEGEDPLSGIMEEGEGAAGESETGVGDSAETESTDAPHDESIEEAPSDAASADSVASAAESIEVPATEPSAVEPQPTNATDMAGVETAMSQAVDAVPMPTVGDFTASQAAIRARGFAMAAARRGGGRARGPGGGGGARLPAREPGEPDPVPDATKQVSDKCNRRLDDVEPRPLEISPQGNLPEIGRTALTNDDLHILLTLEPGEIPPDLTAEQMDAFFEDQDRLEELRRQLEGTAEEAAAAEAEAESAPPRRIEGIEKIEDPGAPPPLNFSDPERTGGDMGAVFARLLADTDATALGMLRQFRDDIKIDGVTVGFAVSAAYPDLGDAEFKDEIKSTLDERIRKLAEDAGIAAADLQTKIDARIQELEAQRAAAASGAHEAAVEAADAVLAEGESAAGTVAAVEESTGTRATRIREAAESTRPAMDVPSRRDRLLEAVTTLVVEQVTGYRQQGDMRRAVLDQAERNQKSAYRFAAQQDTYQITDRARLAGTDLASADVAEELRASDLWRDEQVAAVTTAFNTLRENATTQVETFQNELREAADTKREAIRAWADEQLGEQRTDEERIRQQAADRAAQEEREVAAWAAVENQRTTAAISRDFGLVAQFEADIREGLDRNAIIERRGLSAMHIAMLDAYLTPSIPGASNESRALDAVAAGAQARLAQEQANTIGPRLGQLVIDKPDAEWETLNDIAAAQGSGFHAATIANTVREAVDQWGTNEQAIFDSLANLKPFQVRVLRAAYFDKFGTTIEADLESDMSGRELQRAQALLAANQARADAIGIRQSMYGNWEGEWYDLGGLTGLGTDDKGLHALSRQSRTPEEREAVEREYMLLSGGRTIAEDAHSELEEERSRERFDAEWAGNLDLADALELRDLIPPPVPAPDYDGDGQPDGPPQQMQVVDRDAVAAVYERIRTEVTAQAAREGWTTDRLEGEITRRNRALERTFNSRFGDEYGNPDNGALRGAFDASFRWRPEDQNLLNGLADNDLARIDAARAEAEHRGVYADDDVLNRIVESQYRRALEATTRDRGPVHRMIMARQLTNLEREDPERPWSPGRLWEERQRLQREVDRTFEEAARDQAAGNLNALRDAYERDYHGSFDDMVRSDTQGYSHDRVSTMLDQGGYLTPAQEVFYSVRGAGTSEEALKRALRGRTAEELDEMREEFAELARADSGFQQAFSSAYASVFGGDLTDMDSQVLADVSGRDEFDIGQMLLGDPETVEQRRERMVAALRYEADAGWFGESLAADEIGSLRRSIAALDRSIERLNDRTIPPERREVYLNSFENHLTTVDAGIQAHRRALDSIVDKATTAIGLVVGILAGALFTVLTGGFGGLVLAAVVGSIVATAATMATKGAILGAQYGWEDIATDIAVGVVDAVLAAVTAGMADKLLGLAKGGAAVAGQAATRTARAAGQRGLSGRIGRFLTQGVGRHINPSESMLARMIPTSNALRNMVERGGTAKLLATVLAEGGENLIQGTGSALASTVLNDKTWEQGNPLKNIVSGTLQGAAMSAAMGLAAKPLQGAAGLLGGAARHIWNGPEGPVPVVHDPSLTGRTVKVEYVTRLGGISEIRIVAGPDVRPIDIELHMPTVQAMRRYTGLGGRVTHLMERTRAFIMRDGMPPLGSKAWEAHHELRKLPAIIEDRIRALGDPNLDTQSRNRLLREIESLHEQLDIHQATLDRMDVDPGSGYVAAHGVEGETLPARPAGERADPDTKRFRADGSPLEDKYGAGRVYQIGPAWEEGGRIYRVVEAIDEHGRVIRVREEILKVDGSDRWVQRGKEGNVAGEIGEDASARMTQADIGAGAAGSLVAIPQSHLQNASGNGFDGVNIHFDSNGVATIVLIEVKNYPDRYVPLADFTAIGSNLQNNYLALRKLLSNPLNGPALGLTPAQMQAIGRALKARRFSVEVRVTPSTQLGTKTTGTVLKELQEHARTILGDRVVVTRRTIDQAYVDQATTHIHLRDRIGTTPHFYDLAGPSPAHFTEESVRHAQTIVAAERAGLAGMTPPARLLPPPPAGRFQDSQGNHFVTVNVGRQSTRPATRQQAMQALADNLLKELAATASRPKGAAQATHVLVNVSELTPRQRAELLDALNRAAATPAQKAALKRLLLVDVR